jgi:uncharacterized tellurite resistance protein B-like protein
MIGTINLTRTRETGTFYCPQCSSLQDFRRRTRRPFLTIYFIPVVPIGGGEEFVQCRGCRSNWDTTVLAVDQAGHEAAKTDVFREEAIRAAILIVIADSEISEAEITALQRIGRRLLERPVDREELGELCSAAYQNEITAANYITTVAPRWNQQQRRLGLQAMFLAASAEGTLSEPQLEVLQHARRVMDLTESEFEEVIEQSLEWDEV